MVQGIVPVPQKEVALLLEAGYLMMELGKWKEAQEVFAGVSALVPHSDVPHMALGNLFFAQGKFQQALKCHREALSVAPESALARAHVGESLLFLKKFDEGKAELERAISQDPKGMAADFARALLDAHEAGCFDRV
ncbi:MAG: tetratricopeptide repeat protein [Myxococcota bacterium]